MPKKLATQFIALGLSREETAPALDPACLEDHHAEWMRDLPLSGLPAWRSHGSHARTRGSTLDAPLSGHGELLRLHLLGVFAQFPGRNTEAAGTPGALLALMREGEVIFHHQFVNGRHYSDAALASEDCPLPEPALPGDGSAVQPVARVQTPQGPLRVDLISIDLPPGLDPDHLRFRDLGSPASFWLFDLWAERCTPVGCPFHSSGGGIALAEIGAIVRVGDRVRFTRALQQMEESLGEAEDLDEARGQALTFLAIVTAAMLETGGTREMHRTQLEAARELDRADTLEQVQHVARQAVQTVAASIFRDVTSPSSYLVDRALSLVDRHYARDLSDATVAQQLGLSTSHFRFLFRQTTGQPFHKYLIALRLEKARKMLIEQDLPVTEVARSVGFTGLSHFSRAFTQRFHESPTNLRKRVD